MRIAQSQCRVNLAFYVNSKGNGFLIALGDRGEFRRHLGDQIKVPYRTREYALKRLGEILDRAERFAERHLRDRP